MKVTQLEALATLRMVIGYLGEREQYGWWQSSFFSRGSKAFLAPVFGRTQLLAQYTGVTRAAGLIHDDRIGVGSVYHLFRLPEDVEQGLHQVLHDSDVQETLAGVVANKEAALGRLRAFAEPANATGVGPTLVGDTQSLRHPDAWATAAAQYLGGFETGTEVYPYFADRAS